MIDNYVKDDGCQNFVKDDGIARIPYRAIPAATTGRGKGYDVYLMKGKKGSYIIYDNEHYEKWIKGRYERAHKIAKNIVMKKGEGASLIIKFCSPKKDGNFMLVGKEFVKFRFV